MSTPLPVHARTLAEARAAVLAAAQPLAAIERAAQDCAGRALRADLVAPHALPPFDNAAMDGWAVRSADLAHATSAAPARLPVEGAIAAGHPAPGPLRAHAALRIMTGAPMPEGADTVVPFEDGERHGAGADEAMSTAHAPRSGQHVRRAGEDVRAGERVLAAGRELSAHDLALAVSLGAARLSVSPAIRVAILSTGDELLAPDAPLTPGAIRDSNRPMLAQMVREAGGDVVLSEHVSDDVALVTSRMRAALDQADVLLTIGGVSAGDFDPVKLALAGLGSIELWRVAMRPGRPQAFGRPDGKLFFGLPGNPASVACVFEVLVRPALRALQGFAELDRPRVPVRVASGVESRAGRTDFVRCTLAWRDGTLWAESTGAQVSGHLTPQSRADALLIVPEAAAQLDAGASAEALLLRMPARP